MDWKPHITTDPQVMHGAACFRGTRIQVSVVLDNLAAGETPERIVEQYPSLRLEHIPAAIGYAADLARERTISTPREGWAEASRVIAGDAWPDFTDEGDSALRW